MANTKEIIRIIVKESFDSILESLTDKIYNSIHLTLNTEQNSISASCQNSFLMFNTKHLSKRVKQKLAPYVNESGFVNVATILDVGVDIIKLILNISSANGYFEIVKFLVENGANINDSLALSLSAGHGHLEIVKYLVENGAKIDGSWALNNSAQNGHLEIVKYLVKNGAKTNGTGIFALDDSAKHGYFEIVKCLVENGANVKWSRALINSIVNGHFAIVKFLVESGANINKNILYKSVTDGNLEIVKFLVREYLKKGKKVPNDCITKEINDINKFLFIYTSSNQDTLFNEEIVSSLTPIKSILV